MSKFNLKTYEKIDGDGHVERRLQVDHTEAPDEINEGQLEKGRVEESEVLIEKLLEKSRIGGADETVEKRFEDSTSKLHKHRNSEAYEGDINKLEEQRLENETDEDEEEYEPASETPEAFRWWKKDKGGDKLKLAQRSPGAVSDLFDASDAYDPDETVYDLPDIMERSDKDEPSPEEDLINEVPGFSEFSITDETDGGSSVWISEEHPAARGEGFEIVIGFKKNMFAGDPESLEREIMDAVHDEHPELEGLIDVGNLTVGEDKAFLKVEDPETFPMIDDTDDTDGGDESLGERSNFEEVSYNKTEVGGTPMAIGLIKFEVSDPTLIDDEKIMQDAIDFVEGRHSEVTLDPESLDMENVNQGEIGFAVSVSRVATSDEFKIVTAQKDLPHIRRYKK